MINLADHGQNTLEIENVQGIYLMILFKLFSIFYFRSYFGHFLLNNLGRSIIRAMSIPISVLGLGGTLSYEDWDLYEKERNNEYWDLTVSKGRVVFSRLVSNLLMFYTCDDQVQAMGVPQREFHLAIRN